MYTVYKYLWDVAIVSDDPRKLVLKFIYVSKVKNCLRKSTDGKTFDEVKFYHVRSIPSAALVKTERISIFFYFFPPIVGSTQLEQTVFYHG